MNAYPLSSEQVQFFKDEGYIAVEGLLTRDELADAQAAMDALIADGEARRISDDGDYNRIFLQMVNLWTSDPAIRAVTLNPGIAEVARKLLGCPRLRLWHDHALIKMPGDSRETAWHQDLPYWPMNEEGTTVSCWIALDDVDENNGCMRFIPRSHKLGKLEPIHLGNPQDIFTLSGATDMSLSQAVTMRLRAGDATFHEGRTFHFASANRTGKPRRAMVIIYMADGTTYNGNRHVVTDPIQAEIGRPLSGELFPVVAEG